MLNPTKSRTRAIAQATPRHAAAAASPATVLAIVSAGVFMANLDLFIVNVAFPDIRRDFSGTSLAGLSWILNGYAIVFAALLVPAGRLADRFGQRRGFLAGVALFTAASALCAAAPGPVFLVLARLVQAAGAAALMPTSLALLLAAFPPERRPRAIGIWTAVGATAAAAGPVLGGLIVELSWRWVFLVNLPVGVATLFAGASLLGETRDERANRWPDLAGALLLTGAVATLALAIVQGPDWGWGSPSVVASFAWAALLAVAFVYRSAHHPSPIVELPLLRDRAFAGASLAAFLLIAAFSIMLLSLVQFMSDVWGYSSLRTGLAISPGPLMVPLVALRGPALARRWGAARCAAVGMLLFAAAGLSWVARAGVEPAYVRDLLPGLLVGGLGFGLSMPMLMTVALRAVPPQRFATGSAIVTMARQIGAVLGISILIVILDSAGRDIVAAFRDGWAVMSATSVAAAAVCMLLPGAFQLARKS